MLRIFFAGAIVFFGASVRGQAAAPATLPDSASIDALGRDLFVQSGPTGMVLVVVRDHQVLFGGYGETAPDSHQVPTRDSVVRLCSLTRIFTTDMLTKLVADKTVRLDDTLQRYAPAHTVVPRRGRPITLLDLATHTSGLPRERGQTPRTMAHFTYPDFQTRWRWLQNQHLRSTPGTAALYSNVAYDFLSDALASATHRQYAALLAERTLNPLAMRNTTFFPSAEQCSHLLAGARDERACSITEATAGSSGLYSTASDMTLWLRCLLGESGEAAQDAAAQKVYVLPSSLASQKGWTMRASPRVWAWGLDVYRDQSRAAHGDLCCSDGWCRRYAPEPLQCREQAVAGSGGSAFAAAAGNEAGGKAETSAASWPIRDAILLMRARNVSLAAFRLLQA